MSKICNVCNIEQPIENFSRHKTSKDGRRNRCKTCHNAYVRDWYGRNSDSQRKASAGWKQRNQAKVLATRYGVPESEMEALLVAGKCQICGSTEKLCVDHDHDTGAVRGLLCSGCNYGLGFFKDSLENLSAAIQYLNDAR